MLPDKRAAVVVAEAEKVEAKVAMVKVVRAIVAGATRVHPKIMLRRVGLPRKTRCRLQPKIGLRKRAKMRLSKTSVELQPGVAITGAVNPVRAIAETVLQARLANNV